MKLTIDGHAFQVEPGPDAVVVDGRTIPLRVEEQGSYYTVYIGDRVFQVEVPKEIGSSNKVAVDAKCYQIALEGQVKTSAPRPRPSARRPVALSSGSVTAPIAGRVLRVFVEVGQGVKEGDVLLILEAMKMENELRAPKEGLVKDVAIVPGARVNEGELLLVIE